MESEWGTRRISEQAIDVRNYPTQAIETRVSSPRGFGVESGPIAQGNGSIGKQDVWPSIAVDIAHRSDRGLRNSKARPTTAHSGRGTRVGCYRCWRTETGAVGILHVDSRG